MATFSKNLKPVDDRGGAATSASRSFGALARDSTPGSKGNPKSLNISYGNGMADWGRTSIWGNGGLGSGLASRATTRENSQDGGRHVGREEHASGSQRQTESLGMDDPWNRDWKSSTNWTGPQPENLDGRVASQPRSFSTTTVPGFASVSAATRPQAISLNTTSLTTPSGHRSANSNNVASRGYDPAPTVYTKHDRHQDSASKMSRDSGAAGPWSSVSPTDNWRPFSSSSRATSQPMSRSASQQYASPTDERTPTFTRPDYSRGPQRSTQHSSRTPSSSSQSMVTYNPFPDSTLDQLPAHVEQLSMNGEGRPQTSYRSFDASFTHPWSTGISPLTRPSLGAHRASFGAAEEDNELDMDSRCSAFPTALSPLTTNLPSPPQGARWPPTPTSAEFRPGQGYVNGLIASRGFDKTAGAKSFPEWQILSNGASTMQLNRSPFSVADQQAFLTPQAQQLLAAQARQVYHHTMFNPYSVPGAFPLNPYLSVMPAAYPTVDPSCQVQGVAPGENIQSALLFEFKNNSKSKRYELRDIYDHIAEFSGDQHGSRFIQTKLETANSDEKSRVFQEIEPNAIQLMTDVFGNYVIQKFFEHGDQTHKRILAAKMKGQVLALTNQMYGCRVVQKALDHVLVEQQAALVRELDGHVLRCVKDQNGNHVIQKAIEKCSPHTIGFIINAFQNSVPQLSVNSYGCRVIQRCLEHCDKSAKAMIMGELMDGIQGMITDQYGNYVVQHVVERDEGEGKLHVFNIVMKHLEMFSKHKFASNVVEKCLERADDHWRRDVVAKVSNAEPRGPDGESVLVGMIKDNYGNYVIREPRLLCGILNGRVC